MKGRADEHRFENLEVELWVRQVGHFPASRQRTSVPTYTPGIRNRSPKFRLTRHAKERRIRSAERVRAFGTPWGSMQTCRAGPETVAVWKDASLHGSRPLQVYSRGNRFFVHGTAIS